MKKFILVLILVLWAGAVFANTETERIVSFDFFGGPGFFGAPNKAKINITKVSDIFDDCIRGDSPDPDGLFKFVNSEAAGLSYYTIFPEKDCGCMEVCKCKNHKSERFVIAGNLAMYPAEDKKGVYINTDFLYGSSFINKSKVRLLILGVLGANFTMCDGLVYIEPEIGIETSCMFRPSVDGPLQISIGARGLIGYELLLNSSDSSYGYLTGTIKPKISFGLSL